MSGYAWVDGRPAVRASDGRDTAQLELRQRARARGSGTRAGHRRWSGTAPPAARRCTPPRRPRGRARTATRCRSRRHVSEAGPGPPATQPGLDRMRTVERHLDEILAAVPQPDPIELAVLDAQGLLCAEEVVSQRALPAFDQAALDGYAARADDVAAATVEAPVELAVVGESVAGRRRAVVHRSGPGAEGRGRGDAAARAPTSSSRPCGPTRARSGSPSSAGPPAGQLRPPRRGRRRARRRRRAASGTPIGPAQISLLAAVGPRARAGAAAAADRRPVRRHRAGRRRHARPAPGQIVDVNSYALAAAARDAGAEAYRVGDPARRSSGRLDRGAGEPAAAQRPHAHRRHVRQRRLRPGAGGAGRARRRCSSARSPCIPGRAGLRPARPRRRPGHLHPRRAGRPRWCPSRCSCARRSG